MRSARPRLDTSRRPAASPPAAHHATRTAGQHAGLRRYTGHMASHFHYVVDEILLDRDI
jgi:hypothetical protein